MPRHESDATADLTGGGAPAVMPAMGETQVKLHPLPGRSPLTVQCGS